MPWRGYAPGYIQHEIFQRISSTFKVFIMNKYIIASSPLLREYMILRRLSVFAPSMCKAVNTNDVMDICSCHKLEFPITLEHISTLFTCT